MLSNQSRAERSHVLVEIVGELGGLAHTRQSMEQLDDVIDRMLAHGVPAPKTMSEPLIRWIHTHRNDPERHIYSVLGGHVGSSSVIPDCFGKFFDDQAVECQCCGDNSKCRRACVRRATAEVPIPMGRVEALYPVSVDGRVDNDVITQIIMNKAGQITKTLIRGHRVVLTIINNKLKVLAVDNTDNQSEEDTMATKPSKKEETKSKKAQEELEDEEETTPTPKKGAAAKASTKSKKVEAEDEEEEDLDLEAMDEEEDEDEEEEAPAPKAKKTPAKPEPKKAAKKVVEEEEEEDEDDDEEEDEAPAKPVKKAKKEKPEKAPEPKVVQEFRAKLKDELKDNKALYAFAKKLGVTWEKKDDERINRMRCVMACTAALKAAAAKKAGK